ncbi:MAG: hypothetical protein ACK55I_06540, partial [bacterium]
THSNDHTEQHKHMLTYPTVREDLGNATTATHSNDRAQQHKHMLTNPTEREDLGHATTAIFQYDHHLRPLHMCSDRKTTQVSDCRPKSAPTCHHCRQHKCITFLAIDLLTP